MFLTRWECIARNASGRAPLRRVSSHRCFWTARIDYMLNLHSVQGRALVPKVQEKNSIEVQKIQERVDADYEALLERCGRRIAPESIRERRKLTLRVQIRSFL